MTSRVNLEVSTGIWSDKTWRGCAIQPSMSGGPVLTHRDRRFDIQWLYVKDIPNVELQHIREKYELTAHHQASVNQRKQEE